MKGIDVAAIGPYIIFIPSKAMTSRDCVLLHGISELKLEDHRPYFDQTFILQGHPILDALSVNMGAIRALQILNPELVLFVEDAGMPLGDVLLVDHNIIGLLSSYVERLGGKPIVLGSEISAHRD